MVALDRWSLYTGLITWERCRGDLRVIFIDRWSLYTDGLSIRFHCISFMAFNNLCFGYLLMFGSVVATVVPQNYASFLKL